VKIFLDSAILSEIEESYASGIVDGVTTNPSLMKKAVEELKRSGENVSLESYIKKILLATKGTPVSLEVTATKYGDMVKEGKVLYRKFNATAKNVVIKIPVNTSQVENFDGIKAIKTLSDAGIPVNCTLIFTPEQALLAAKAGAKMVSPFAGRIDDALREGERFDKADYYPAIGKGRQDNGVVSGVDLVAQCVRIFKTHGIKSRVLAASIRNTRQLREMALAGADIATVPFYVLKDALKHAKTAEGMRKFSEDAVPEYTAFGGNK